MAGPKIDEIGPWSEVKLDILKRYAVEYSKIFQIKEIRRSSMCISTHLLGQDFIFPKELAKWFREAL